MSCPCVWKVIPDQEFTVIAIWVGKECASRVWSKTLDVISSGTNLLFSSSRIIDEFGGGTPVFLNDIVLDVRAEMVPRMVSDMKQAAVYRFAPPGMANPLVAHHFSVGDPHSRVRACDDK